MKISSSLSKLSLSTKVSKLKVKVEVIEGGFCCFPAIVNAASGHCLETKSGLRLSSHSPWLIKNTSTTVWLSSIALDKKLLEKTTNGIEWCFTIWILNGICASMSGWARSLACLCLFLSLVDWLVWSVIVGWVFCWCGFQPCLRWVCWVSTYLRCVFLGWDFFLFALVVLYFWIDLVLWGFGIWWFCWVWENGAFEIYDFVLELKFLGFLCVCFLRKFLGLLVCLLGNNMIFMC